MSTRPLARQRIACLALLLGPLLAACGGPNGPDPRASFSPSLAPTPVPSPIAEPTLLPTPGRPDPGTDAPAIAAPFWLAPDGGAFVEVHDKAGEIVATRGMTGYRVFDGGKLDPVSGAVLEGRYVGSLRVGLDPTGQLAGSPLDPVVEHLRQYPGASASTRIIGTARVRIATNPDAGLFAAFWWSQARDRWYVLTALDASTRLAIVAALLAPDSP